MQVRGRTTAAVASSEGELASVCDNWGCEPLLDGNPDKQEGSCAVDREIGGPGKSSDPSVACHLLVFSERLLLVTGGGRYWRGDGRGCDDGCGAVCADWRDV